MDGQPDLLYACQSTNPRSTARRPVKRARRENKVPVIIRKTKLRRKSENRRKNTYRTNVHFQNARERRKRLTPEDFSIVGSKEHFINVRLPTIDNSTRVQYMEINVLAIIAIKYIS